MSKVIRVSNDCMEAIRLMSTAPGGFKQTGSQLANGDWNLEISTVTYNRLMELCSDGRSVSDAIMLAIAVVRGEVH